MGDAYEAMVETGYQAMLNWDGTFVKKVGNRRPNYEALYVLWFLKGVEQLGIYLYFWIKYILLFLFFVCTDNLIV